MAAGMDHVVQAPGRFAEETDAREDWARTTVVCTLQPGERLRVVKHLAYGWSSVRSAAAVRDQVAAGLTAARFTGWEGLLANQRDYLDEFWDSADVEVEGTRRCSRPSGSGSSTSCRAALAPSGGRCRPRG